MLHKGDYLIVVVGRTGFIEFNQLGKREDQMLWQLPAPLYVFQDGGQNAGAGEGEHRVVCSASCDYGYIFKHGNAEEAFGRADKGRI